MSVDERSLERTEELAAQLIEHGIRNCQDKALGHELPPVGQCHAGCGARLTLPGQKFCDDECAEDWNDAMKAAQRKTGIYRPHSLIMH
ncbi:MAG: hypothetical protein IBX50_11605 [Marinospirillum sp.]|uniref:hypothetical protein n=1 Tax=Marinospirillum sp. TaxID=2183934 RepID=UPI001A0A4716|nr:hypothetical protein [Marinospirillum sp.]MBE0507343.1 hypothetical protein [Marinospirillum sp.]